MKSHSSYSAQIITDVNQLTEALNLRYRIYKKAYPLLLGSNPEQEYETDVFDKRSVHLGLYCENNEEKKLAGYCRFILPEKFSGQYTHLLLKECPLYQVASDKIFEEKLAFIEKLPDYHKEKVITLCNSLEEKNVIYAETSRFIIEEEHSSILLTSFFVLCMFTLCDALKIKYSFLSCPQHHATFYKRFRLTPFESLLPYTTDIYASSHVVFGTDLVVAGAGFQSSIKKLQLQYRAKQMFYFSRVA